MRVAFSTLAVILSLATSMPAEETLQSTFAKLDNSAGAFRGMTADIKQTAHTGVVDENQVATGEMRVRRNKPGDTRMLVNFAAPDEKMVQLQGQTLSIFLPKLNTVDIYDLGKNSSLIEQFLLLGFGTTSKDLTAANTVTFEGSETIDGHPAVRLLLVPKSKEILQHIDRIQLWLSPSTGYPLQHKIYQHGGDYQLFQFGNLQVNPATLTDNAVKLKLPKNVKTEHPQR